MNSLNLNRLVLRQDNRIAAVESQCDVQWRRIRYREGEGDGVFHRRAPEYRNKSGTLADDERPTIPTPVLKRIPGDQERRARRERLSLPSIEFSGHRNAVHPGLQRQNEILNVLLAGHPQRDSEVHGAAAAAAALNRDRDCRRIDLQRGDRQCDAAFYIDLKAAIRGKVRAGAVTRFLLSRLRG